MGGISPGLLSTENLIKKMSFCLVTADCFNILALAHCVPVTVTSNIPRKFDRLFHPTTSPTHANHRAPKKDLGHMGAHLQTPCTIPWKSFLRAYTYLHLIIFELEFIPHLHLPYKNLISNCGIHFKYPYLCSKMNRRVSCEKIACYCQ